jgi:leucyl-tRNA synthetase
MVLKYSEKSGHVEKMSKSQGNVVNPDEMVAQYGTDALRMYMMFMGPPELDCEWQDNGLEGMKRYLQRLYDYLSNESNIIDEQYEDEGTKRRLHRFLKDFQERITDYKPNTAISAMMEWLNDVSEKEMKLSTSSVEKFLVTISIITPFIANELLQTRVGKKLEDCAWPTFDPNLVVDPLAVIVVQVNGKVRANIELKRGASEQEVRDYAQKAIEQWLLNKEIVKVIFVKDKLISFVVR